MALWNTIGTAVGAVAGAIGKNLKKQAAAQIQNNGANTSQGTAAATKKNTSAPAGMYTGDPAASGKTAFGTNTGGNGIAGTNTSTGGTAVKTPVGGFGIGNNYSAQRRQNTYNNQGQTAVRQQLTNAGLKNSSIGWDGTNVTYNGLKFKPATVTDGVSYANEGDVNNFIRDIYSQGGDELVRVADYVSDTGITVQPVYENGKVYLGGRELPVAFIENGRSYAPKSVLDQAYAALAQQAGVKRADEAYNYWKDNYASRLENELAALRNARFTYDLENDPAYQAYKEQYEREGQRAYRNAAAQLMAQNGGNMTSMAQAGAAQQLDYYLQQLNDRVPELQQNAYARFQDEQQRRIDAYDRLMGLGDSDYNRRGYANELARDYYNEQYDELKNRDAEQRAAAAEEYANSLSQLETKSAAVDAAKDVGRYDDTTSRYAETTLEDDPYIRDRTESDIRVDESNRITAFELKESNKYMLEQMAAEFGYNVKLTQLEYMNEQELARLNADLNNWLDAQKSVRDKQAELEILSAQDDYSAREEARKLQAEIDIMNRQLEIDLTTMLQEHHLDDRENGTGSEQAEIW